MIGKHLKKLKKPNIWEDIVKIKKHKIKVHHICHKLWGLINNKIKNILNTSKIIRWFVDSKVLPVGKVDVVGILNEAYELLFDDMAIQFAINQIGYDDDDDDDNVEKWLLCCVCFSSFCKILSIVNDFERFISTFGSAVVVVVFAEFDFESEVFDEVVMFNVFSQLIKTLESFLIDCQMATKLSQTQ